MKTLLARLPALCLLGGLLVTSGCTYSHDRLMDLTDILDIKYGVALGAGVKVEVTTYLGAGAGLAGLGYSREWYGRRSFISEGCAFFHAVVAGVDGGHHGCTHDEDLDTWTSDRYETYFLLANLSALTDHGHLLGHKTPDTIQPEDFPPPPFISRWRVGGEFIIPVIHFGLYFNFGEFWDFLAGIATFDPAEDDGVSKLSVWTLPDPPVTAPPKRQLQVGPPTPGTLQHREAREAEQRAVEQANAPPPEVIEP